jgi:hypothetical protein
MKKPMKIFDSCWEWLSLQRVLNIVIACAMLFTSSAIMGTGSSAKEDWFVPRQAREMRNPVGVSPQGLKSAARIYQRSCASCHGRTGASNGPAARALPQDPADFTNEDLMRKVTDGELFWKISTGRAPMPSYLNTLSATQRWQLVNYLRMLAMRAQYRYLGTAE